jgi:peptidase E
MTLRRILATSGGFVPGPTQQTVRPGTMLLDALEKTGKTRPRVTLVLTASGDDSNYYHLLYEAFSSVGCDLQELRLFPQPSGDPNHILHTSDLVWVGGGSVANLLSLWQLHHVNEVMASAWESGVIMAGVSAGSLCWHVGGTTDSFGTTLQPVTNGLRLVPYGNGVHYDSEAQRRPLLHELMSNGVLPAISFATDDGVGIWYENETPVHVVVDSDDVSRRGASAYKVELINGQIIETPLPAGRI